MSSHGRQREAASGRVEKKSRSVRTKDIEYGGKLVNFLPVRVVLSTPFCGKTCWKQTQYKGQLCLYLDWLQPGKGFSVTCGKGGGGNRHEKRKAQRTLAKLLAAYTSGNRKDENAQHLEVGYPSDFLQQGIRIIDTPGTNSLEQWHEDVTKEAIREQADACIILTSAEKPFPESFCRFWRITLKTFCKPVFL